MYVGRRSFSGEDGVIFVPLSKCVLFSNIDHVPNNEWVGFVAMSEGLLRLQVTKKQWVVCFDLC